MPTSELPAAEGAAPEQPSVPLIIPFPSRGEAAQLASESNLINPTVEEEGLAASTPWEENSGSLAAEAARQSVSPGEVAAAGGTDLGDTLSQQGSADWAMSRAGSGIPFFTAAAGGAEAQVSDGMHSSVDATDAARQAGAREGLLQDRSLWRCLHQWKSARGRAAEPDGRAREGLAASRTPPLQTDGHSIEIGLLSQETSTKSAGHEPTEVASLCAAQTCSHAPGMHEHSANGSQGHRPARDSSKSCVAVHDGLMFDAGNHGECTTSDSRSSDVVGSQPESAAAFLDCSQHEREGGCWHGNDCSHTVTSAGFEAHPQLQSKNREGLLVFNVTATSAGSLHRC
jgi:hypothetical protein